MQAELFTGVDLNGDTQIGLTVESQITTGTASNTGLSRYLYNTNEGLLISTASTLLTETIPSVMGLRLTADENRNTLLLNEAGDAVFNLDTSDIQQVVQRKERDAKAPTRQRMQPSMPVTTFTPALMLVMCGATPSAPMAVFKVQLPPGRG